MINEVGINIASVVSNVVSENRFSHCRLCLCDIEENFVRFEDCVSLNPDNATFQPISEILSDLLEDEICEEIPGIDAVCTICLEKLMETHKFLEQCKHSTRLLTRIFNSLGETLSIDIETTSKHQRLYVIIDETESKIILDDKEDEEKETRVWKWKQNFTCEECQESFDNFVEFRVHSLAIHGIITCDKCQKTFQDETDLENHKCINQKYKCGDCNEYSNNEESLREHRDKAHTVYVCKECGKSCRGLDRLQAHEEKHVTKNECPKCGKTYITRDCFVKHVQLCLEDRLDPHPFRGKTEKSYFCEKCGKGYSTSGGLRVHDRFVHGSAKPHVCEFCGKKFTAPSYLKIHMVKHTGEKNFKCNICGNNFVSREALLYHTRRHTGEKPYSCQMCNERFVNASARAEHIKFKHQGPKLTCDVCNRKFFTASFLRHHRSRHYDPASKLYVGRSAVAPNVPTEQNMRVRVNMKADAWTAKER